MTCEKVNIYRSNGEWCYAAFTDEGFDSSDTLGLDADATDTAANNAASAMFPSADVCRVDDIGAAQSASGRATAEKLGPEGRTERAKAGAAARWSEKYRVEYQEANGWTDDGLGYDPAIPGTLTVCREAIASFRKLARSEDSWKGVYRIVRESDGAEMERHFIR